MTITQEAIHQCWQTAQAEGDPPTETRALINTLLMEGMSEPKAATYSRLLALYERTGTPTETAQWRAWKETINTPRNATAGRREAQTAPDMVGHLETQTDALQPRYEGIGLYYLTTHGIGIKPHYAETSDKIAKSYSIETPVKQGKPYKAFIAGRFLVLDIDRHPDAPDGIQSLYAWLDGIGKPRDLLPPFMRDIDGGSFPAWQETPHGGYHLFFKYSGAKQSDPSKGNFTDTQGRQVKSIDILAFMIQTGWSRDGSGKPYIFHGNLDQAPALPDFIRRRLPHKEKPAPVFIPLDKKKYEGATPWAKIVEFTDADGRGGAGRNEWAYSAAVHAKTHNYTEAEALAALQNELRIEGLPNSEIQSAVKSAYRGKQ
jgi:hypothetical protein